MRVRIAEETAVRERAAEEALAREAAAREKLYRQFEIFSSGKKLMVPLPSMLVHHGPRAQLGKKMLNDKRLACSQRLVCGACHWLGAGGTDSRLHHGLLTRPAYNAVFANCYMQDGSLTNLHDVVETMIRAPYFCGGGSLDVAVSKLSKDSAIVELFNSAYKDEGGFNGTNVVDSVVEYMKTLITSGTPYDYWCAGHDDRFTPVQRRGSELFISARCMDCHDGPTLGARKISNGRKVPALRGLSFRKAYLTDGKAKKLEAVIPMMPGGALSSDDMKSLLAFLSVL